MRKLLVVLIVAITGTLAVPPAMADSPHFLKASASINSSGALVCSFKEAGLGNVPTADITCSASATVVYQCFNNGGNHPKAGNKKTVSARSPNRALATAAGPWRPRSACQCLPGERAPEVPHQAASAVSVVHHVSERLAEQSHLR